MYEVFETGCHVCGDIALCVEVGDEFNSTRQCRECINDQFDRMQGKYIIRKKTHQWETIIFALEHYADALSEDLKKATKYEDGWGDEDAVFLSHSRDRVTAIHFELEGYEVTGNRFNRRDSYCHLDR